MSISPYSLLDKLRKSVRKYFSFIKKMLGDSIPAKLGMEGI